MPTYDYGCDSCGKKWEFFQLMKDSIKKTCPFCKRKTAKRLISRPAGIHFKGSGFWETDYNRPRGKDEVKE